MAAAAMVRAEMRRLMVATVVRRAMVGRLRVLVEAVEQAAEGRRFVVRAAAMRGLVVRRAMVRGGVVRRLRMLMQAMEETAEGGAFRRLVVRAASVVGRSMVRGLRVLVETVEQTAEGRTFGRLVVRAASVVGGTVVRRLRVLVETVEQTTEGGAFRGLMVTASVVRRLGAIVGRLRVLMRASQDLRTETLEDVDSLLLSLLHNRIILTVLATTKLDGDLSILVAVNGGEIVELAVSLHVSFKIGEALVIVLIDNDRITSVASLTFLALRNLLFVISIHETTAAIAATAGVSIRLIAGGDGDLLSLVTALAALVGRSNDGRDHGFTTSRGLVRSVNRGLRAVVRGRAVGGTMRRVGGRTG
jgi:hypothetical protein